jgi:hypothetical protein
MVMTKHYGPIPEIINYLVSENKNNKKILEIGPGYSPFPLATHFIDHVLTVPNTIILDVCNEKFPFADKEFDFVYARHILEDVQNPTAVFNELVRVGKRGYIETPSVIVEVARHIDGSSPSWRGYVHHRYMFWNDQNTLVCIPKYPIIEYIEVADTTQLVLDPFNWNNYYQWDSPFNAHIKELKHGVDYDISTNYKHLINNAVTATKKTCQAFKNRVGELML